MKNQKTLTSFYQVCFLLKLVHYLLTPVGVFFSLLIGAGAPLRQITCVNSLSGNYLVTKIHTHTHTGMTLCWLDCLLTVPHIILMRSRSLTLRINGAFKWTTSIPELHYSTEQSVCVCAHVCTFSSSLLFIVFSKEPEEHLRAFLLCSKGSSPPHWSPLLSREKRCKDKCTLHDSWAV